MGFFRRRRSRREIGADGETAAVRWLERSGYRIEARNWLGRGGELDIVAIRDTSDGREEMLVFVEVRTVRSRYLSSPTQTVDAAKQRRVARAADQWLRRHRRRTDHIRFDVIGVYLGPDGPEIEHIENAFAPPGP